MKTVESMTRKEITSVPIREKWDAEVQCDCVILVPTRRKHDSGYLIMDIIAVVEGQPVCKLGGGDNISLGGIGGHNNPKTGYQRLIAPVGWQMDCLPKSGLIRLWASRKDILSPASFSTMELFAVEEKRNG